MPKDYKKSFKMNEEHCTNDIYCYIHQNCNRTNNVLHSTSDKGYYDMILYTLSLYCKRFIESKENECN